ncbi:MAG: TIGR03936 family radical SAM-associated protein [Candidatus Omnitrophota bacterium]
MELIKLVTKIHKHGKMRYISHLDFIRLIYRAIRRADLPFALTLGFNPRPKIKFGQALKLGVEAEIDVTFFLEKEIDKNEFKTKMHKQLHEGIRIVEINYGKQ